MHENVKTHSYEVITEESNNKAHDDLFEVYRRIHLLFVNPFEIVNKYSGDKRTQLRFDFLIYFIQKTLEWFSTIN